MSAGAERWNTYVQASGAGLRSMLTAHLAEKERDVVFILGKGFDPRMNLGLRMVLDAGGVGRREVIVLEFDEGPESPSQTYSSRVEENFKVLTEIVHTPYQFSRRTLQMFSPEGRRLTSRSSEGIIRDLAEFGNATDIVVDVSSLPRGIFFPLIAKLLHLIDNLTDPRLRPNLVVFVAENAAMDSLIAEAEIDEDADYLHPFRGTAEREATASHPKVWFPILGEGQKIQLTRINDLIRPDEICAVLPSPSLDPRRGDNLILEYRELLFDELRVEPRNFVFASELNPFEAYRQLRRAIVHYTKALGPLGGCRSIVTSVSSKLLSLGGLLAAYELKREKFDVSVAHIEASGYRIEGGATFDAKVGETTLYGLWLTGEFYAN